MSDKFPSKQALLSELELHLSYLKLLYEEGYTIKGVHKETHTLSDVAFTYLVRDMERIIHAVEHNLEIPDRVPDAAKEISEPPTLDMFPFVDEFTK